MSYKPPFARMRAIRAKAPAPIPRHPQNVEEAIAQAAAAQKAGEEVAEEIRVPVGDAEAVITPGPDKQFGTEDDVVEIEAVEEAAEEAPEPEVAAESSDEDEAKPDYSMDWRKADLVFLAESLALDASGTKAEIIAVLDAHYA